jgi:Ca2+-binding EF-hand superfamily protein
MKKYSMIMAIAFMLPTMEAYAEPKESGGDRREMMKQKMQERLKEVDTNSDGIISKAEFMAKAEERFSKMDANGDGNITEDERGAMRDKLKQKREGGGFSGEQFP